ncbi:hypothetical protein BFW38_01885 [Terasakiispira papahanaumokuakeensis]|uniref:DUF2232 domain-containing protein n=1 Tax=Terasakiispira papahanaumokuakeensis TaxID=197479 RepID=A0A1E2V640_9GAMM|nr:hypothetical protein [Terasakiispira papahanaumokuakeensis]ODC02478.1 hypothetical protein BFW38_01885 [Terasakiispira papahanaumokuakeensis]
MQSRVRATSVATIAAAVPFLGWLAAALVALVSLRMGPKEGLMIMLWTLLPGIYYWVTGGSPGVVVGQVTVGLMALMLFSGYQLSLALLAGAGVLIGVALSVTWLPPDAEQFLMSRLVDFQSLQSSLGLDASAIGQVKVQVSALLNGVISAVQWVMTCLSLFLARWLQSALYGPAEAFGQEFRRLQLPRWSVVAAIVLGFLASQQMWLLPLLPVLMGPFLIAGLSVIHGIFMLRGWSSFWLGGIYVALIFALPEVSLLLVLVAMADSWVDFRHRLAPPRA